MADSSRKEEAPPAAGPDAAAESAADVPAGPAGPPAGRQVKRPVRRKRPTGPKREAEIRQFTRHLAAGFCTICKHPEKDEIETAYLGWHSNTSIAKEFTISVPYLKAHAEVFEWNRRRSENMDALYSVLFNSLVENFDPSQLAQKDILGALGRMSRHTDRLQGRIIDRHQVDQRKTVTFVAIPLAGGSAPIIPAGKQKVLAPGSVIDVSFEPTTPHGQEESFADPTVGLDPGDVSERAERSLAEAASKDRRSAPAEEKEQE